MLTVNPVRLKRAEMKERGLEPTTATYNVLMDAYSKRMQPEIIENLLLEMQGVGLKPNVKSYVCLISAHGRQTKMSDMVADAILEDEEGCNKAHITFVYCTHPCILSGWMA